MRPGLERSARAFTQSYGSDLLDASLLVMPLVGFLPADDERVRRTVEAIERDLVIDGFVHRYHNQSAVDGLRRAKAPSCRAASGWPTASP